MKALHIKVALRRRRELKVNFSEVMMHNGSKGVKESEVFCLK